VVEAPAGEERQGEPERGRHPGMLAG